MNWSPGNHWKCYNLLWASVCLFIIKIMMPIFLMKIMWQFNVTIDKELTIVISYSLSIMCAGSCVCMHKWCTELTQKIVQLATFCSDSLSMYHVNFYLSARCQDVLKIFVILFNLLFWTFKTPIQFKRLIQIYAQSDSSHLTHILGLNPAVFMSSFNANSLGLDRERLLKNSLLLIEV